MTDNNHNEPLSIVVTPTWVALVPLIAAALEAGGLARDQVMEELYRMAGAADRWNTYCKAQDAE